MPFNPRLRVAIGCFVLCAFMLILASHARSKRVELKNNRPTPRASKKQKTNPDSSGEQQITNIPYFTLRDGMSSALTLNNIAPLPTTAHVTIFNTEGRSHLLAPIIIEPHSFKQIELRDVVPVEEFESGNVQVAFSGAPMALTCQVTIYSFEKRISFESREQDMMEFSSSKLNGILWLPQPHAEGFLAITNMMSKGAVTIQVAVGVEKKVFVLTSRETRLVKLSEEPDDKTPGAVLVSLEHNGMPGEVTTTGFVLNPSTGYSSTFTMVDSSVAHSNRLAGTHFRFGSADVVEGFPAGTRFRAPLLLANIGNQPVAAHISVDYTLKQDIMGPTSATGIAQRETGETEAARSAFRRSKIRDLTLPPRVVQNIDLAEELARLGVEGPTEEAGLDISYDSTPGSVIAQLTSVDQTGDYSFEVPIKDPEAITEMMEGVYPWTIEDGWQSVLHLKNTTDDSVGALVIFELPVGKFYNPDRIVLKPYQTVAIDIQKLKDSKQPDVLKRAFPSNATHGQVQWRQEIPYSMIGRLERTNHKAGIASSFSCGNGCCQYFYEQPYLSPNSVFGLVGGSIQLTAWMQGTDCNNVVFNNPITYQPTNWTSSNTSAATVDSSGRVTYVGAGSATISTNVRVTAYFQNFDGRCQASYYFAAPSTTVTVQQTTVTLSPTTVVPGAQSTVTVTSRPAVAGQTVTLSVVAVPNSGGHQHAASRPVGRFTNASGTTNSNGQFTTQYTASAFGGSETISGTANFSTGSQALTVTVPGLVAFAAGSHYQLVGPTSSHPLDHYGTATANANLVNIANQYAATFPGASLSYNDQSLPQGGQFDINFDWNTPHVEHRLGINCDVAESNVPTANKATLVTIFVNNGSPNYLHETAPPHWHLRFGAVGNPAGD